MQYSTLCAKRDLKPGHVLALLLCVAFVGGRAMPSSCADELHFEWIEDAGSYRSPQAVYKTRHGNECFRRMLIPRSIGNDKIRGVIVWDAERHYYPNGPRSTIQTSLWREFAAQQRFGMIELASRPLNVEATVDEIQKILEDMDVMYGRTECRHACFTFGGTSGTGQDTLELASYRPIADRMIAGFPCSARVGGYDTGQNIPLLVLEAGREKFAGSTVPDNLPAASAAVRAGKPITFAVRLSATHPEFRDDIGSNNREHRQIASSMVLAMIWLDAIIDLRVPEGDPPTGHPFRLTDIDTRNGWLASCEAEPARGLGVDIDRGEESTAVSRFGHILTDCRIDRHASFGGGLKNANAWLPNEATAMAWKEYHEAGAVSRPRH